MLPRVGDLKVAVAGHATQNTYSIFFILSQRGLVISYPKASQAEAQTVLLPLNLNPKPVFCMVLALVTL